MAICFSSATRLFPSKKGVSTRNIGNIAQCCWLLGLPGYPTLEILQPWLLQSFWSAGRSCKHLRTEGWTCAPTWVVSQLTLDEVSHDASQHFFWGVFQCECPEVLIHHSIMSVSVTNIHKTPQNTRKHWLPRLSTSKFWWFWSAACSSGSSSMRARRNHTLLSVEWAKHEGPTWIEISFF